MDTLKKILKRYFIDALGAMALGLFSSLIIGLIISQIATLTGLMNIEAVAKAVAVVKSDYVVGAAIGIAIAWGMKVKPLTMFSAAVVGAVGYAFGGPVGAYLAAVVGAEVGNLLAGKTKVDIVITPFITIVSGGAIAVLVGPGVSSFMTWFGGVINHATELAPIPMGIIVAVLVGLALTAPISSAALCIMIGIDGIAAGAACVGCCCQMIGFAAASWRDNGLGGAISQGIGTSMLQFPNIMRRPAIWLAPTLASAVLGPVSTAVLAMQNTKMGAGMGTSGLVGQFGAYDAMGGSMSVWLFLVEVLVMHFILPAALTLSFDAAFRKLGWVRKGDMKIFEAK